MKRSTKHVALDVHQATPLASVREDSGRVIARSILPTEAPALVEFFRGMRGTIHGAFEEGTKAQWLHELLTMEGNLPNRAHTIPGPATASEPGPKLVAAGGLLNSRGRLKPATSIAPASYFVPVSLDTSATVALSS